MAQRKFLDELYEGFANGVESIRHEAVETAWFGREVTGERESGALAWPEPMEEEPRGPGGLSGEILPPESSVSHAGTWPGLEHGTVIEGQAQDVGRENATRLDWPQGRNAQEPNNPERDRDVDIDR